MHKANVFIALATDILGGPGKGLEQFLRYGGLKESHPLVIDYTIQDADNNTEFSKVMKNTGVAMAPLYQKKTFDLGLVDQSLELIKKHNIQILQSHGYKSHVLCYFLHRKTKLPWIGFVHGWTHENLRVRLYAALEQVILLGATEVVAVSESLRSRLIAPVRNRAKVIPNALAADELTVTRDKEEIRQELGIEKDSLVLCIIGRLSPEKGHDMLFKAVAKCLQEDIKVHTLVVGQGQEHDTLHSLIKELDIEKNCSFVGHVRDTANYYNASDIQIMPSTTEGMPNAALEGMHMGLPLIATHVGGIPEVVLHEKTGILIPSGDSNALAKAIIRLAQDAELRKSMGEEGKHRIKKEFNPYERAKRILHLYDNTLNNLKKGL